MVDSWLSMRKETWTGVPQGKEEMNVLAEHEVTSLLHPVIR
jgi:hypothetical protein